MSLHIEKIEKFIFELKNMKFSGNYKKGSNDFLTGYIWALEWVARDNGMNPVMQFELWNDAEEESN